jgi:hypothetical protein
MANNRPNFEMVARSGSPGSGSRGVPPSLVRSGMSDLIDWVSFLVGLALQFSATILVYLFLPESIREPIRSAFLRARKFIRNPPMELKVGKRLGLREAEDSEEVRSAIVQALREAGLCRVDGVPRSLEFPVVHGSFKARAEISTTYDPDQEENRTPSIVVSLTADTRYRGLRATLEDLRSTEDAIRRALQMKLSFVESPPQVTIKLESEFPMSAFFKEVQPLVLTASTRDGRIDFDYTPGQLTARGSLDAEMIQWLRGAIASL